MTTDNINTITSSDGLLRYSLNDFLKVPLTHLMSDLHHEAQPDKEVDDTVTLITGFTEWGTEIFPCISIGWDWQLTYFKQTPKYSIIGLPFSNIQIIDGNHNDIEFHNNIKLLNIIVDMLAWENIVHSSIFKKYSSATVINSSSQSVQS